MTWGQLRLQLQTSAPGKPLDLLDQWLNDRYHAVIEATDWQGLKAHATIQTVAAYQSVNDTVAAVVGSNAVAGTGTAWTDAITGRNFYIPGDSVIYTATFISANALALDRPYEGRGTEPAGAAYPAAQYVFMTNVYTLPADCDSVDSLLDPITEVPMQAFTKDGLDQSVGPRTLVEWPKSYAVYDDTPENAPPVLHQVELYPPPIYARGIPLYYRRNANVFDGENTSTGPLPWISPSILLNGVRADIALDDEKLTKAAGYETLFAKELARMLLVEHAQRRTKDALKMASRFTRHRMARAARGLNRGWGKNQGGPN